MIAKSYGVPTGLGPDVCIPLQPCGQTEGDLHWQITRRVGEAEGICKTAHSDVGGGRGYLYAICLYLGGRERRHYLGMRERMSDFALYVVCVCVCACVRACMRV